MKYSIFAATLAATLLATACAEGPKNNRPSTNGKPEREPATVTVSEPKKDDQGNFEGYWRRSTTGEENVVSIIGRYKDEDQGIVTEVSGIDLFKDFGYRSLPLAADDTVVMKYNPDRKVIEALLRKTINSEPSLFEMVFSQPTIDSLRIEIRLNGKLAVHEFTRISDEADGQDRLDAIHERLMQQELRTHFDGRARLICTSPHHLSLVIESHDLKCLKTAVGTGVSLKTPGLLRMAVKTGDPAIVEYLLQQGVTLDPLALNDASSGGLYSIGFAQHGWTSTSPFKKRIQKMLIKAGVDFNQRQYEKSSTAFGQVLSFGGDAEALEMMLDRGADPKCDCAENNDKAYTTFTINFETRWGKKGPALLERLLKAGIDLNTNMGMFLNFAVREVDVASLKVVAQYAPALKTVDRISLVRTELTEARKALTEPAFSPYLEQQRLIRKIKRLEENLAFLSK